jgi:hypothetical protein
VRRGEGERREKGKLMLLSRTHSYDNGINLLMKEEYSLLNHFLKPHLSTLLHWELSF